MKSKIIGVSIMTLLSVGLAACGSEPSGGSPTEDATQPLSSSITIYSDALGSGWTDWSWSSTRNFANRSPSIGTRSIRVDLQPWSALYLHHAPVSLGGLTHVEFSINPGSNQRPALSALLTVNQAFGQKLDVAPYCEGGQIASGKWSRCSIPMQAFAVGDRQVDGFVIQENAGRSLQGIIVDEIRIVPVVPAQPGGLNGARMDTGVNLSWSATAGATGYHVYRSDSPSGPFVRLTSAAVASTSFVDAGALSTAAQSYAVSAVNSAGEGPRSAVVTVQPLAGASAMAWVYRDALEAGWQDWSWAPHSLAATTPVSQGTRSISASFGPWEALYFVNSAIPTSGLEALILRVHGGTGGTGAALQVRALVGGQPTAGVDLGSTCAAGRIVAGAWTSCNVPVSKLAPAGSQITGFQIQEWRGGRISTIYFDEVGFTSSSSPAPQKPTISVSPLATSVQMGATARFTARVSGTTNTAVSWSVQESGGGTIDSSGLYVAPMRTGTFHVIARSAADSTVSASATVSVDPAPVVAVSVSPATASVTSNGTIPFAATVSGVADTSVTWSVAEGAAGGTVDSTGLYRAPSGTGTFHVVATSRADSTRSASATVTVSTASETPVGAGILPQDRRDTWNPGIPGGIPTSRRVFATLSNLSTDGRGDNAPAINQAIVNAHQAYLSSGVIQEVVLPAGTIRVAQTITLNRSGVVLRGAGMKATRIRYDGGGNAILIGRAQFTDYGTQHGPFALQADAMKGGRQIVVSNADAQKIQVGDILTIDQEDDPSYVRIGDARYEKRQPSGDTNGPALRASGLWRSVTSMIRITAKAAGTSNTTLTLADPLHMSFKRSFNAQVFHVATEYSAARPQLDGVHYNGVEDLYFTGGPLGTNNVAFCWIKNVEADGNPGTPNIGSYSNQAGISGRSVNLFHAYRCEVRGSYVHHSRNISQGGGAYLISISSYTSESLIEDNIVVFGNKLIVGNMMGGGNVIGYNYVDNARTSHESWQEGAIDLNHQSFTHSALVEGNWATNITSDTTHGNAGWHVFLRNHATGQNSRPIYGPYPYTAAPDGSYRRAAGTDGTHREATYIGNVLFAGTGVGVYQVDPSTGARMDAPAVWRIGWGVDGGGGNADDGTALRLLYRHGNWDSVSNGVVWDSSNSNRSLPDSLYLKGKPGFFGSNAWPWVNPLGATAGQRVGVLPAKARYDAMNLP